MNHPLSDMMTNSMSKIRDMIDVNTVVGDPITTPGGVTIIPVTKVSIGYGAGGSDFATKNYPANRDNAFGGGAGADDKTLFINKEYTSLYNNKEYKDVADVPAGAFVILKKK